jgi:hypothetical protein
LRFTLLVLKSAVQEHNTRVLNLSPHLGVCDVLVHHDAVQHTALLDLATRDLLHAGVALDVDFLLAAAGVVRDGADSGQRQVAHHV